MRGTTHNPAKFERCVKDVRAKGGVGNAYAVCQASVMGKGKKRNPASDAQAMYEAFHGQPSTETVEIEEREHYHEHLSELGVLVELRVKTKWAGDKAIKFETGDGETRENPMWPFGEGQLLGGRTTVLRMGRRGGSTRSVTASVHKGYTIYKTGDAFTIPQLDRESRFDTKKDAQRFIDDEVKLRRNGKRGKGPITSAMSYGMDVAGELGGDLDRKLGKAIGFKGNPLYKLYYDGVFSRESYSLTEAKKLAKERSQKYGSKVGVVGENNTTAAVYDSGRALKHNPEATSSATTLLTCNEKGSQLFFTGGDQSLDLDALKFSEVEQEKELITIGKCFFVSYLTQKDFDKFETIVYEHELGEESGVLPDLVYDRLNKKLMLSSGEYHIERPMFETSPGIEN